MSAPYVNTFETETVGSLPSSMTGFSSPAGGTTGVAIVTDQSPLAGSRSLKFPNATDSMALRVNTLTSQDIGFVLRQPYSTSKGQAGPMIGIVNDGGYVAQIIGNDTIRFLAAPSFAYVDKSAAGGDGNGTGNLSAALGRSLLEGDELYYRLERIGSSQTVRAKAWLVGTAEPAAWQSSTTNTTYTAAGQAGFRVFGGSGSITVDDVEVYDFAQLNAPIPAAFAPTNTSLKLVAPNGSGGSGALTYQWKRGVSGGALTAIAGATSTVLNDTGLTPGTTYSYALVVTDAASNSATSPTVNAATTGTAPTTPTPTTPTTPTPTPTATPTIAATAPAPRQILQRDSTGVASIPIAGTYTGTPGAIEASWNGGAFATIVANPSGGTFAGTLAGQATGQGSLVVRFVGGAATVTVPLVGVGDVFLWAGQSNAVGQYTTQSDTYKSPTYSASMLGYDGLWKDLADRSGDQTNSRDPIYNDTQVGGSVLPALATGLMANLRAPVAFIPCGKDAAGLAAGAGGGPGNWLPNLAATPSPTDRTTYYGSMVSRVALAGPLSGSVPPIKAILWWQGETDAIDGVSQATYYAALGVFVAGLRRDIGAVPFLACKLQNSTYYPAANGAAINAAIGQAAAGIAGFKPGPDLSDLAVGPDALHLISDGAKATAASRWNRAILAAFDPAVAATSSGATLQQMSDLFDSRLANRFPDPMMVGLAKLEQPTLDVNLVSVGPGKSAAPIDMLLTDAAVPLSTAYAGIGNAVTSAMTGLGLTAAAVANLDAKISSRSTFVGPAGFNSLVITGGKLPVAIDWSFPLVFRDQSGLTAPTGMDSLAGMQAYAVGKETRSSGVGTITAGDGTLVRTFSYNTLNGLASKV